MNILILSKDPSLFHKKSSSPSDSHDRHVLYLKALRKKDPHATIKIISYTPRSAAYQIQNPVPGLTIIPTRSLHRIFFLRDLDRLINKTTADWMPDLITAQEAWEEGQLGLKFSKALNCSFLAQIHFDLFSESWKHENIFNPIKKLMTINVLKQSQGIRVVSNSIKNNLIKKLRIPSHKITVIPVPITIQNTFLKTKKSTQKPMVLFVGRLVTSKNLFFWIEIAVKVIKKYPQVQFVIAGKGPLAKKLTQKIRSFKKELPHENSIQMLGPVPYHKLPTLYQKAALFLLTSKHEGFARVIAESYQNLTPVISSSCAGPQDLILNHETGILISGYQPETYVNAILNLLKNTPKINVMAKKGRNFISRNFNRSKITQQLISEWVKMTHA